MAGMEAVPPLEDQLGAVKKREGRYWIVISVLGLALAASQISQLHLTAKVAEVADRRPIYVVPGAAEGVYAPGLTKYNVANAARYLLGLGANLTAANAADRLAELERYCTPEFLPRFKAESVKRLKEIQGQTQSRALQPDRGDSLSVDARGLYTYTVSGVWEIKSGSLLMSEFRHRFQMRFSVGHADQGNPYGVQLQAFDVVQLDEGSGPAGAADTATVSKSQT